MQVSRLAAAAFHPLLLLLLDRPLLHLLHLARGRQIRPLQLRAQLRLARGQLALAPEVHKVAVHVHVELRRVRVDGLGRVVLLLPQQQHLVLGGEVFQRGHARRPAVLELAHGDAGGGREAGEVGFELVRVRHGVLRVVAEGLFARGRLVLGDDGDAVVVLERAPDQRRVLLEVAGQREEVEDVGERGGDGEFVLQVLDCVDHVCHDFGARAAGFAAGEGRGGWRG